ncbi:hypothetical protein [Streptosporangium sp. NPDC051022]|uniref:hypothetical protein n=1 Tax=Streptosporangium sp. NPDC051022 TaxID=3155752 RepID=UPI00343493ED
MTALVTELAELLERLEELPAEPVADPTTGTMSHHKVTGSPAPWRAEAGPILMDIHEGVRRLEASLRREVAGHLGARRGGSDANTVAALASIARLDRPPRSPASFTPRPADAADAAQAAAVAGFLRHAAADTRRLLDGREVRPDLAPWGQEFLKKQAQEQRLGDMERRLQALEAGTARINALGLGFLGWVMQAPCLSVIH